MPTPVHSPRLASVTPFSAALPLLKRQDSGVAQSECGARHASSSPMKPGWDFVSRDRKEKKKSMEGLLRRISAHAHDGICSPPFCCSSNNAWDGRRPMPSTAPARTDKMDVPKSTTTRDGRLGTGETIKPVARWSGARFRIVHVDDDSRAPTCRREPLDGPRKATCAKRCRRRMLSTDIPLDEISSLRVIGLGRRRGGCRLARSTR